jgi:phenylpropionate dioxygenase-like ring-hydroxylating dioxygenase large terminal subunit
MRTLSPRCYRDPAFYALEQERVFRPGWHCVAREDQVANPGDYLSLDLLGEPLVAVRDESGVLRVLSRVCRHRWMPVVEGCGNRRSFQCPYHLWTYALDGRLRAAPEMDRSEGFDRESVRLPELRVEIFEGFVFASFDPEAAPLAPRLSGLRHAIAPYRPASFVTTEPLEFVHEWNWKVMVENFVESYHHMGPHADTLQPIVPAAGTIAGASDGPWAVLHNPTRDGTPLPALFPPTPGLSAAQRAAFVVGAVFPFHLFSVQHDSMFWYQLEPTGPTSIRLRIHPCVPPESVGSPAVALFRGFVARVHAQDIAACRAVQTGLASRLAGIGTLSHLEGCLGDLHEFIRERVGAEACA